LARLELTALLVGGVLVLIPRERTLEFADPSSHRLAELRKALRPEDDQDDHEDDSNLKRSHVGHRPDVSGTQAGGPDFSYRFRSGFSLRAFPPFGSRSKLR